MVLSYHITNLHVNRVYNSPSVFAVQFEEDVDRKDRDEPNVSEVNSTCCSKPWVFDRSLFTSTKERRKCENTDWNACERSTPPCSVPSEDRLADYIANESGRYCKLGKVLTPSQIAVREQYIPIRENESCLCVWVGSAVQWWWNQPCIEQ